MEKIVNNQDELPEWITSGRTVLFVKNPTKDNVADNFRPITCLLSMRRLMTGIIAEGIYEFLEGNMVLPNEQEGCRRKSRRTKGQLLIDKMVLKDCRRRNTDLAVAWIDYGKSL